MFPKISRYSLMVVAIVVLATILPQIYHTLFDVRINVPYITYSTITDDFFIMKSDGDKAFFIDTNGNEFTQEEFIEATPVSNYFYHVANGIMPDSINGVNIEVQQLRNERFRIMLRPQRYSSPEYRLYPLFESEPKFGLSFPKDFFRVDEQIEFITAESNTINQEKSRIFTKALSEEGFKFPADVVSGIPSILKSRADGWFITDSAGGLYHIKMVKGKPFVEHITTATDLAIRAIFCTDFRNREFYALIVTQNNGMFLLGNPNYELTKIPINDYKPDSQMMIVTGNLFNRTFTLVSDGYFKSYSLNRDYEIIDTYYEQRTTKSEMLTGRVFDFIFPFHINFETPKSRFIKFTITGYQNFHWLYLNLVLFGVTFFLIKRADKSLFDKIPDLIVVVATGVFGFIAIHMFPNKKF